MSDEAKFPESLNFDYLKSGQFHVIHADGAYLATSASGLTVTFFSERQPIPRRVVHKVNSDGSLGDEIIEQRVIRDAIVRDVEIAIAMNFETAKRVRDKLVEMVAKAEELSKKATESRR